MEDLDTNRTNLSCLDNIGAVTDPLEPYQTLSLLVPINDTVWTDRSKTWTISFIIIISLFALTYFCIGLSSVVLMIRKDSLRTSTKTFFAVYLTMIILGFSRAALFTLDPFGVLGFIGGNFDGWIIVSRYLNSLGFPSLVGACTLIILTLVKLAQSTDLQKQWYEYWKYVLILIAIPYVTALTAESLGHITQLTALFSGLACEIFFSLWGISVCIFYLVAGKNLLVKLQAAHRRATMLSESSSVTNTIQRTGEDASSYFKRHHSKAKRIKRKIVKITFGTAIAGIFYALVSAGGVIMVLLLIFYDCMGRDRRTNSDWWLAVQFFNHIAEIILAAFILYSITDASKFTEFLQFILSCCYCCFSRDSVSSGNGQGEVAGDPGTVSTSARGSGNLGEEEAGIERVQNVDGTDTTQAQNGHAADKQFKIDVNDPDGSIESGESSSVPDRSSQRHKRVKKTSVASMAQKERKISYNSISGTNPEERPLELVGQIFSVTDSPTFGRSYHQNPLKFFRRTHSREISPDEVSQHPDTRRLKHIQSSPVPASPRVQEKYSVQFDSPLHPVTPLPAHITSPITPNSPQSPYCQKPSETQKLLSSNCDSASKLSRKGTV